MTATEIPTTEDIRTDWMAARHNGGGVPWDDAEAEFDAWLAQHDAEVAKRVLGEARHAVRAMTPAPNSRLTWESAQSKAARTLLDMENALRATTHTTEEPS